MAAACIQACLELRHAGLLMQILHVQVSSAEQEVSCSGSSMQGHFDAIAELINSQSVSNADRCLSLACFLHWHTRLLRTTTLEAQLRHAAKDPPLSSRSLSPSTRADSMGQVLVLNEPWLGSS